jgi:hypothetical protein
MGQKGYIGGRDLSHDHGTQGRREHQETMSATTLLSTRE